MILRLSIFIASCFLAIPAAAQQNPPAPSADEVARRAMDVIDPSGALGKARFVSFTFNVEREGKVVASFPQAWDRSTGEYRVSGKTADGISFDVSLNLKTKMGHGTMNGRKITDSTEFKNLFEIGYRHFVNDMSWLLLPLRMFEPGVHRTYDGQRTDSCGRTWDLVKLTFDQVVGLPAGDTSWLWVNRDTGMIEEWDIKPQNSKPEDIAVEVVPHAYRRVAGLLLPMSKEIRGRGQTVVFGELKILPDVPKEAFQ